MPFDLVTSLRRLEIEDFDTDYDDSWDYEIPFKHNGARRRPNHGVVYKYPDLSLLPKDTDLTLVPPASAEFRSPPGESKLASLGINFMGTTFFTISPIKSPPVDGEKPVPVTLAEDAMAHRLISAMHSLPTAAGDTVLSMVTYTRYDELRYRLKRKTVFEDGRLEEEAYKFSTSGWLMLGVYAGAQIWLRLLDNLYLRTTDLACFHVRDQLIDQGEADFAYAEANKITWGRKLHWDAVELVLHRLKYVRRDADGMVKRTVLSKSRLHILPDSAVLNLPCKHRVKIFVAPLLGFHNDTCAKVICPTCDQRVLTERDEIGLALLSDYRTRSEMKKINWQALDFPITDKETRTVLASAISDCLEIARSSIGAPNSIIPMALDPECFEETDFVLAALQADLANREPHLKASPVSLFEKLISRTQELLHQDAVAHGFQGLAGEVKTPHGWTDWVLRWFHRTVNFMWHRECEDGCEWHRGMHWHGDETFYNPTFEREYDEEEDELVEDEDELPNDDIFDEDGIRVLADEEDMVMDDWCS